MSDRYRAAPVLAQVDLVRDLRTRAAQEEGWLATNGMAQRCELCKQVVLPGEGVYRRTPGGARDDYQCIHSLCFKPLRSTVRRLATQVGLTESTLARKMLLEATDSKVGRALLHLRAVTRRG